MSRPPQTSQCSRQNTWNATKGNDIRSDFSEEPRPLTGVLSTSTSTSKFRYMIGVFEALWHLRRVLQGFSFGSATVHYVSPSLVSDWPDTAPLILAAGLLQAGYYCMNISYCCSTPLITSSVQGLVLQATDRSELLGELDHHGTNSDRKSFLVSVPHKSALCVKFQHLWLWRWSLPSSISQLIDKHASVPVTRLT